MNLLREQRPYEFIAPKYAPWFRPILNTLTRLSLRIQHSVESVDIVGGETVSKLTTDGHSVLVTPNHADHADPELMMTAGRRGGYAFHFMAAREGFEKSPINRFVMRRGGAFSVNREGGDVAAIKMAIKILEEANYPLVIFPEGEIYHHMETLDELNEGVASMALRAGAKLKDGKNGYVVPTAIRLRYGPIPESEISNRLSALEERITWKPRTGKEPVERILDLGSALLAIKEEEYLGGAQKGPLEERLNGLREALVGQVEKAHGALNEGLTIPKRIKAIRAIIRREITDSENPPSEERSDQLYDELDRVFLAHQLYSYPGVYLLANPTVDRIAETIFKLEEDVTGKGKYLGKRRAEVRFGEPVDTKAFLKERELNTKSGVEPLTELIRDRIRQLMIE